MPTVTDEATMQEEEEAATEAEATEVEAPEQEPQESPQKRAARTRKRNKRYHMTDSHKEALAGGRRDGANVRAYLEAVSDPSTQRRRGKRGRKPLRESPEQIDRRLRVIDETLPKADVLHRLQLVQERMELQAHSDAFKLAGQRPTRKDMEELEQRFIKSAKSYAERKGISYRAFREVGVPAAVLKRAGIPRTE